MPPRSKNGSSHLNIYSLVYCFKICVIFLQNVEVNKVVCVCMFECNACKSHIHTVSLWTTLSQDTLFHFYLPHTEVTPMRHLTFFELLLVDSNTVPHGWFRKEQVQAGGSICIYLGLQGPSLAAHKWVLLYRPLCAWHMSPWDLSFTIVHSTIITYRKNPLNLANEKVKWKDWPQGQTPDKDLKSLGHATWGNKLHWIRIKYMQNNYQVPSNK